MTSTAHIDMSGFAEMAKTSTLPTLQFDKHSTLQRLSSIVTERVIAKFPQYTADKEDVTQEEFTEAVVEIVEDLQDEPDLTPVQVEMHALSNETYLDVQHSFHILRHDVASTVDQLVSSIYAARDVHLKNNGMATLCNDTNEPEDPLCVKHTDLPESEGGETPPREVDEAAEFTEMEWDRVLQNAGSFDMLVTEVESFSSLSGMKALTRMGEPYLLQKMTDKSFDIDIDDADFDAAVKQVQRVVGKNDCVTEALQIAFHSNDYLSFYMDFARIYRSAIPIEQCAQAKHLLSDLYPVFKAMKRLSLPSLTDEKTDQLKGNLESIKRICLASAYQMWFHRKVTFGEAILLDATTINPDTKDSFFSNGGSYSQLKDHLRANYVTRKSTIPTTGLNAQMVCDQKTSVTEFLTKYDQELMQKKNILRMDATTKAVHQVLEQYVRDHPDKAPAHLDDKSRGYLAYQMAESISTMLHGSDDNLEHAVYTFLLQFYYPNTMVTRIFDLYNKEAVTAMESQHDLSKVDVTRIDAMVALELMTEHLYSTNV